MRNAIYAPNFGEFGCIDRLVKLAVLAEKSGFDGFFLWDHINITGSDAMMYLRLERDRRLGDTDWWANTDRTMTDEQTTYRKSLRDLPANNPNAILRWEQPPEDAVLEQTIGMPHGYTIWVNVNWPKKPE